MHWFVYSVNFLFPLESLIFEIYGIFNIAQKIHAQQTLIIYFRPLIFNDTRVNIFFLVWTYSGEIQFRNLRWNRFSAQG